MATPYDDIPDIRWVVANRFQYIDNEVVKQNVAVCFQYIMFLVVTKSLYKQGGPISLSLNRDIVVHTASMVEAILHHGVSRMIKVDPEKKKMLTAKWQKVGEGYIHKFDGTEETIMWVRQVRVPQIYSDNPQSQAINKAALDVGLIDAPLFDKAEAIRIARNNIHFIGENKQISYPSEQKINEYFDDARDIFTQAKTILGTPAV